MQTIITSNADKVANLVKKLREGIKKQVIPHSLDQVLSHSLEELKNELRHLINSEIRYKKESINVNEELPINIASSDKTILQYFGYNLDSVKTNSYSKDSYDSKIKFIQDYTRPKDGEANLHCRVEVPALPGDSIEEIYNKALKNFQDSLYVDNTSGIPRYLVLTDKGKEALKNYIKIFCSTFTGIQDGPALIKAQHRRKLEVSKGWDYSFWAVKQEGLKQLLDTKNGFSVEVNDTIDHIKSGNAKEALNTLQNHQGEGISQLKEKIQNFGDKKNLTPDAKSYSDLIELINNLKISKKIVENSVTYSLVSNLNQDSFDLEHVFVLIKQKINIWKITNENLWINKITDSIVKLIKEYLE